MSAMTLFDGKKAAIKLELDMQNLIKRGESHVLAIVQIGDNPVSYKYIQIKTKLCDKLGLKCVLYELDENLPDEQILQKVKSIYEDPKVGGGIIQLPLPRESLQTVLSLITVKKDIDMLSPVSQEIYYSGDFSRLPPVIRSLDYFIKVNELDVEGMKTAVLGLGYLVGRPSAFYLKKLGAHVDVIEDYKKHKSLNYQLVVLSAGVPSLVDATDIQSGCHVVDFGSSIVNGKTMGDLDMTSSTSHLGIVSASPGGMGPLVVRCLVSNFLEALL